MNYDRFSTIDALAEYMDGADHMDVKSGSGDCSLREFVAGLLSYQPGWMQVLWKIRVGLLSFLRQGDREVPDRRGFTPDTLPVKPGDKAAFFTVADSDDATYWVATGEESHLGAAIGVVAEAEAGDRKRFHVLTVVRYRNWAGPIYFNLIRPFHHLVVVAAMNDVLSSKRN